MTHRRYLAICALLSSMLFACEETLPPVEVYSDDVAELGNPPAPPTDASNKYVGDPLVIALGKKFYFDKDFSGPGTHEDMLRRQMHSDARAEFGEPVGMSCNTCHEVARSGADFTSMSPDNAVSIGAGAYDVNGQQTINAAYSELFYWNGRNDSLWSQVVAVVESPVSMNGNRLRVAWRIVDAYREEYEAAFPDYPLPSAFDSIESQKERLNPDGSCKLVDGMCDTRYCRISTLSADQVCLPRFPLQGRPGLTRIGEFLDCDWGHPPDVLQTFGDAYDCMGPEEQAAVTRIYVNFAKAIAAYEYTLISTQSAFDRYVTAGGASGIISASAARGAALFVGKAACAECHAGPMLTDNKFYNIGLPQVGEYVPTRDACPEDSWCDCVSDDRFDVPNCLPSGYRDGVRKLQTSRFRRDGFWSDDRDCQRYAIRHRDPAYNEAHPDECGGRVEHYSVLVGEELNGLWKTPTLRDVARTPPYMHNGMFATLREVVEHYNTAGEDVEGPIEGTPHENIEPLNLTEREIDDIVAFLETLNVEPLAADVVATPELPPASAF